MKDELRKLELRKYELNINEYIIKLFLKISCYENR